MFLEMNLEIHIEKYGPKRIRNIFLEVTAGGYFKKYAPHIDCSTIK